MPKTSIYEAIRILFPGVILYLILYVIYPQELSEFAQSSGTIGFPLILFVIGSLIYFFYRSTIYDPIIERLQYIWNPFGTNYRQEFINRYDISFDQASRLFLIIRNEYLKEKYNKLELQASGIHMLYQASIICLTVGASIFFIDTFYNKSIILLVLGCLLFFAAYFLDSQYESIERDMIIGLGWDKIDLLAHNLEYKHKKNNQ